MKDNRFFVKLAALLLILVLCLGISMTACSETEEQESGEVETEEPFEPVRDSGEESDLYKRYAEYKENSTLAFKNNSALDKESFSYEIVEDKAKIVSYTGDEAIIVVPEEIEGAKVTEIAKGAFSGGGIRAVYLPDTIDIIAQGAFDNCEGLSTIRIPFIGDGGENAYVGYIFGADEPDKNAIALPPSLDMIIVGECCGNVADEAFKGAKTLSAVILPDSASKIGKLAFYQCVDLVYITAGGVNDIDEYAFAYCTSLYDIDISSAKNVAKGTFYSCSALHSISLTFGENDYLGRLFDAESAEYNDELVPASLRRVTVAEGTEKIPQRAFYSCKYLTEIVLPESLEEIGVRSFYACRSLAEIVIPNNAKTIRDDAFFGCDNLARLTLGDSLETIGMQAFFGCESLESVECPESLKEIGPSAFYGCKSLVSATLGGASKVGRDAFGNCPSLSPIDYSGVTVE